MMITLITPIIVILTLFLMTIKYLVTQNQRQELIPITVKDEPIKHHKR